VWRNKYPDTCLGIATIVDHIGGFGRMGDQMFWSSKNWQPMCASCHGRKTKQEQSTQKHDDEGNPLDPDHPWNKEEDD